MGKNKAIEFFEGNPIEYIAQNERLKISLVLRSPGKMPSRNGADYTYEAKVQAEYSDGGMSRSKTGWTHHAYWMHDSGSFGGIFKEMVDSADTLCYMLRTRTGNQKPHQSSLIRLMHKVEDKVKKDFLNPRSGWTDMREDLLKKYFDR